MSKKESLIRYNLIIKKLRKFHATFEEIMAYLAFESALQEYDFNVSKRTFQRDLNDIRTVKPFHTTNSSKAHNIPPLF